jgi:hypothetical protein
MMVCVTGAGQAAVEDVVSVLECAQASDGGDQVIGIGGGAAGFAEGGWSILRRTRRG